ncbi:MAG TPA: hypothetical protein VNB90_06040 [Cytophagaceae bacterium]|jgi:hypothetical protein|nr:hypothetical protein [Cytophagaceae bacterium]
MLFDFEEDVKLALSRAANEIGFKVSPNLKLDDVILNYLTVRNKLIKSHKRNISINPEFSNEIEEHPKRNEILEIIRISLSGGNLNIFQSKRLIQTNFHDHLLAQWNIYHFHLSLEKDKKSNFVKQIDWLLFAYVDNERIIFLGANKHTPGIFGDKKWIEILHDFFPKVIEQYKIEMTDVYPNVNSVENQMLWDKGYSLSMIKIRDVVYFNPGHGIMTSGHSSQLSSTTVDILRWIYSLTSQIKESYNEICEYIQLPVEEASFKIRLGEETLELYEVKTGIELLKFPSHLISREELLARLKIK